MFTLNSMIQRLQQEANTFLQDGYGLELHIPIQVNRRLKRILGRLALKGGTPQAIELSADLLQYHDWDVIVDVLKHECIHYACVMLNKPYRDSDAYFQQELKRHGVARSGTYTYRGKQHLYRCITCDTAYWRHQKFSCDGRGFVKRRRCGCCHGRLKYIGHFVDKKI